MSLKHLFPAAALAASTALFDQMAQQQQQLGGSVPGQPVAMSGQGTPPLTAAAVRPPAPVLPDDVEEALQVREARGGERSLNYVL